MKIVWVLVVLANNGHFVNTMIPTLEFTSKQKCDEAIVKFVNESNRGAGTARMKCVEIEK